MNATLYQLALAFVGVNGFYLVSLDLSVVWQKIENIVIPVAKLI